MTDLPAAGITGETVAHLRAEADSCWVGDAAYSPGGSVTATNGNEYMLAKAEDPSRTALQPTPGDHPVTPSVLGPRGLETCLAEMTDGVYAAAGSLCTRSPRTPPFASPPPRRATVFSAASHHSVATSNIEMDGTAIPVTAAGRSGKHGMVVRARGVKLECIFIQTELDAEAFGLRIYQVACRRGLHRPDRHVVLTR